MMRDALSRREFMKHGAAGVAGAAVALKAADGLAGAAARPRIVVARGGAADTDDGAAQRLRAALDRFGGFPDLIRGKRVLIKMNATCSQHRDGNTSTQAAAALLRAVNDAAPQSVTVLGQEWGGFTVPRAGQPTLAQTITGNKATLVNLPHYWAANSEASYRLVEPQPEPWRRLMVAAAIFEENTVLLNVARLKSHPHCVFTGTIKNIIGLTRCMYGFHKIDETTDVANRGDPAASDGWHLFAQKLGNAFRHAVGPRIVLNILDAGEPMFGWRGPGNVRPHTFPAGVMIVGRDALAVDVYGCGLLHRQEPQVYPEALGDWSKGDSPYIQFNRTRTNYLRACGELGVGQSDLGQVDVQEVTI